MNFILSAAIALTSALIGGAAGALLSNYLISKERKQRTREINNVCLETIRKSTETNLEKLDAIKNALNDPENNTDKLFSGFELTIYETLLPLVINSGISSALIINLAKTYSCLTDFQKLRYELLRPVLMKDLRTFKALSSNQHSLVHNSRGQLQNLISSVESQKE